jgi:hypothetical protein
LRQPANRFSARLHRYNRRGHFNNAQHPAVKVQAGHTHGNRLFALSDGLSYDATPPCDAPPVRLASSAGNQNILPQMVADFPQMDKARRASPLCLLSGKPWQGSNEQIPMTP